MERGGPASLLRDRLARPVRISLPRRRSRRCRSRSRAATARPSPSSRPPASTGVTTGTSSRASSTRASSAVAPWTTRNPGTMRRRLCVPRRTGLLGRRPDGRIRRREHVHRHASAERSWPRAFRRARAADTYRACSCPTSRAVASTPGRRPPQTSRSAPAAGWRPPSTRASSATTSRSSADHDRPSREVPALLLLRASRSLPPASAGSS